MGTTTAAVETPQAKRDRLWDYANGPRAPRSAAYMRGIQAKLRRLATGESVTIPYLVGTAECDAFFAGISEADFLWTAEDKGVVLTPSTVTVGVGA